LKAETLDVPAYPSNSVPVGASDLTIDLRYEPKSQQPTCTIAGEIKEKLIRRVNDNPETLAELFRKLSFIGVPPYYVFQCRPALGNKAYAVPIEEGYQIFEKAKAMVSGLAKRARYVMSHSTGKLEIVGVTQAHAYFKYHRAAHDKGSGRFMVFERNPEAYWLRSVMAIFFCFQAGLLRVKGRTDEDSPFSRQRWVDDRTADHRNTRGGGGCLHPDQRDLDHRRTDLP
jgi:hypothetical protein